MNENDQSEEGTAVDGDSQLDISEVCRGLSSSDPRAFAVPRSSSPSKAQRGGLGRDLVLASNDKDCADSALRLSKR